MEPARPRARSLPARSVPLPHSLLSAEARRELGVTMLARDVCRSLPVIAEQCRVCAMPQEEIGDVLPAAGGGAHERCVTDLLPRVDVCAPLQEQGDAVGGARA